MDISALLARFSAESPLVITRGGPATAARLACEAARAGRRVALVVRSREELTLMRGLVTRDVRGASRRSGSGRGNRSGRTSLGKDVDCPPLLQSPFVVAGWVVCPHGRAVRPETWDKQGHHHDGG